MYNLLNVRVSRKGIERASVPAAQQHDAIPTLQTIWKQSPPKVRWSKALDRLLVNALADAILVNEASSWIVGDTVYP